MRWRDATARELEKYDDAVNVEAKNEAGRNVLPRFFGDLLP